MKSECKSGTLSLTPCLTAELIDALEMHEEALTEAREQSRKIRLILKRVAAGEPGPKECERCSNARSED